MVLKEDDIDHWSLRIVILYFEARNILFAPYVLKLILLFLMEHDSLSAYYTDIPNMFLGFTATLRETFKKTYGLCLCCHSPWVQVLKPVNIYMCVCVALDNSYLYV